MANITKIKLPSGDTYDIVDEKSGYITSDTLPIATASTLGGIKVGSGLNIDTSTGILSATGTSLTIDTAISTTSTNPVQNKAIGNALATKVNREETGFRGENTYIYNENAAVSIGAEITGSSSNVITVDTAVVTLSAYDNNTEDYNYISLDPTSTVIKNVVTPTDDTDAANKQYVDDSIPSNTSIETTGISIANHSTTSIYGVGSSTTTVTGVQSSTTTASKASGANSTAPTLTFAMDSTTTTQLNITWSAGSASTWSFSDVTVPIKNTSSTTVPIKNSSSTTVVTSATHSITDSGHNHDVGNYL